jgi:phosphoserine aminotransferase
MKIMNIEKKYAIIFLRGGGGAEFALACQL